MMDNRVASVRVPTFFEIATDTNYVQRIHNDDLLKI